MQAEQGAQPTGRSSTKPVFPSLHSEMGVGEIPLRELFNRKPLVFKPDLTLRDTLFALNQSGLQAGVVADDPERPLGIVTLRDLIDAITLSGASLTDPAFAHMIAAPFTLPADAPAHRAKVAMTRGRLSHVVLVEADGSLFNLLSPSDLPGFREGGAEALIEDINLADNVEAMAKAARAVRRTARELFANGMGIEAFCQWMSGLNDLICIRVIELVADEYDLPPVSWCWMVFGSEGRLEQTFATDQDNGLIFQPDKEEDTKPVRKEFVPFARAVNRALDTCGFALCRGNIMAGNPAWCLSAAEWQERFRRWMMTPEPEALLYATIFFDFRPLYGQDELVDDLHHWLLPQPAEHPRFLRAMATEALTCSPSLGWFGTFSYDGGRDHPHTIDLKKRGARPFVDAARIWGLQCGVWTTNTVERLRAVGPQLRRAPTDTAASVEAFDLIQRIRIQNQLGVSEKERANRVNPAELSTAQRLMIKEAFKQAKVLQLRLRQEFAQ